MDFWVWVAILVIAWALEAVANAGKKKKRKPPEGPRVPRPPAQPRPRPRAEQPPAPRPMAPRPPPRVYLPEPVPERRAESEPVIFEVPVWRAPRPREVEPTEPVEGISAETGAREVPIESTEPQHMRALEKYGPVAAAVAGPAPRRRRFPFQPANLREAVIWTEILGRPKGGW